MTFLILACGNADRGDDAAGLLVARRLREWGVEAQEHSGDGLSLLERWQNHDAVILIDTVVTGGDPGAVMIWDAEDAPVAVDAFRGSHAFGVAEAVKLARALDRLPAQLWICGIEGRQFDLGSAPSPEVAAAAEHLAQRLFDFVKSAAEDHSHSSASRPAID